MKKALSILLVCILMISSISFTVQAAPVEGNVTYTLAGYGIIDANEQVNMNEPVTRGEFAGMVTRLMCINESASQYTETPYWDVPADYKYASDVSILTAIGIFNGFSDTIFGPNEYVTYEQALKILVLITGYGDIALRNGGWPAGYEYMATKNRMLGGVTLSNPFPRAQLYKLIYNTLDVKLVGDVIKRSEVDLAKTRDTIRSQIADKIQYELYRHKGVIIANPYTYTTAPFNNLFDDEVVINNLSVGGNYIYSVGNTNAFDLVGCEVDFYARKTDTGYVLLSVRPSMGNEVIEVTKDEFGSKNGNKISYKIDGNHGELVLDGSYKVVKNGNRIMTPAANVFEITDGYISFIDNDGDHDFDLALIWEYKNAIATSFDGKKIDFANDAQFRNLTSLAVDKDNRNVKIFVTDKDGNNIESFDTERTVSIFENSEKTRYRVVVFDEIFDATISKIGKKSCTIGESEYGLSSSLGEFKLSTPYRIYIDYMGKLAFVREPHERNYGFILNLASGFLAHPQIKMIIPSKVDTGEALDEEGKPTGKANRLVLHNDSTKVFDFAEKVRVNGKTYPDDEVVEVLQNNDARAVTYKLNEEGKITEITPLEAYSGYIDRNGRYPNERFEFNIDYQVFGGKGVITSQKGFAVSAALTMGVAVPANDDNSIRTNASEADLDVVVNINQATADRGFRVEGYDYDPVTKKARLLVMYASMNSESLGSVISNVFAAGVKPVIVLDEYLDYNPETDEEVRIIEVLEDSNVVQLTAMPINENNLAIERVREGDLIVYTKNDNGLLSNVIILDSLPDLMTRDYYDRVSGNARTLVGKVGKIDYDEVDSIKKVLVTKFDLYLDDTNGAMSLAADQKAPDGSRKNSPYVYLYDSNNETYYPAKLQDIIPETDQLYLYTENATALVKAIVIFR